MTVEDFRDIIVEKLEAESKKARGDLNGIYTGLKLAIDIINEEYDNIPEMSEEEFVEQLNNHKAYDLNKIKEEWCKNCSLKAESGSYSKEEDEYYEDPYAEDYNEDYYLDYPRNFKKEWKTTSIVDLLPDNDLRKRLFNYGFYKISDLMFDFKKKIQYDFVDFDTITERIGKHSGNAYDWYLLYNELIKRDIKVINQDIFNINYEAEKPNPEDATKDMWDFMFDAGSSTRARNGLFRAGFKTLADFKVMGPIENLIIIKDIGKKSIKEIKKMMKKMQEEQI